MRRPGRLEKEFELSVPSVADREEILRRILKEMDIPVLLQDDNVKESKTHEISYNCLHAAAVKAHGMVASDLVLVCKEAIVHSLSNSRQKRIGECDLCLCDKDLLVSVDRVVPSAMQEVAVDVPCVKWTDIGGMDDVKKSIREVMWPYNSESSN